MSTSTSTKKPAQAGAVAARASGSTTLPISRVHKIIKADKDVRMCSKEAIFLISKLTEIATGKVMSQSQQTARLQKRAKTVKYDDLAANVARPEWFCLQDVIPTTITKSQAEKQRAQHLASTGHGNVTAPSTGGGPIGGNPVKKIKKKPTAAATTAAVVEPATTVSTTTSDAAAAGPEASQGIEMDVDRQV